ncbi:peptidase C15 [Thermoleptolyngbya sichuanensis A183]|uniref:Peptidase C15 n=1 Tax=Thermoleptolyngbya sichuanensis A183 TaxID=2737172 RepID=A0A6M8BD34_9CYAN|nr:peptidase C15 [Thermoleptolyngbya sichuanensis]QKD81173.1 peptidase C15 [Thermoleptolyngbya sichuanensis A183]
MTRKILLTSFTTWKLEQPSNSSDDLLADLLQCDLDFLDSLHVLRRLPVDFEQAPKLAIAHIQQIQPDLVVCCGMAETRDRLTLEVQAVQGDSQSDLHGNRILKTSLDLPRLAADLPHTDLSYDAGRFVCNALYFSLLEHAQTTQRPCLFVHIPVLTPANRLPILQDFCQVLHRLIHL